MTVYGDLLFLINFSMDFLCFYLSCLLLRERLKTFRACISSAIGGVYSVASLFINVDGYMAFAIDISVLLLMCFIAYTDKGMTAIRLIKRAATYFIVSSLLGGFMTAVFSLMNRIELFGENMGIEDGLNVWVFAILALISSILTLKGGNIFRTSGSKKEGVLEILNENKAVRLRALLDSGNLVCEPISGKSVIFVRLDALEDIFDKEEYDSLKKSNGIDEMPISLAIRMRPIFSQSVVGSAIIPAVRFKNIYFLDGKRRKELDVYIGILKEELKGGYDAIISNEVII